MPVKSSTTVQLQLHNFTYEETVAILVTKITIRPCVLAMEICYSFGCLQFQEKNEFFCGSVDKKNINTAPIQITA